MPHPDGKAASPANGKQCFACGKWDHLGKVYLHPNSSWRGKLPLAENRTSGRKQDTVRYADTTETPSELAIFGLILCTRMHRQSKALKKSFAHLDVMMPSTGEATTIKFQIYSEAPCNVIPKQYLQQLNFPTLQKSRSVMSMYNSDHMKPLRIPCLECRKNGHKHNLAFQVVDGEQLVGKPPLLCGSDCEKLELLSVNCNEVNIIEKAPLTEAVVKAKYNDVFHGLGYIV